VSVAYFSFVELAEVGEDSAGKDLLDRLDAALRDPGAFRLGDVPVPAGLVEKMHRVTTEFFELPRAAKERYRQPSDPYIGWCGGELLSEYGSADRKEMFHIGPRVAPTLAAHGPDGSVAAVESDAIKGARQSCALWPALPTEFVAVWHEYYRTMQWLAARLGEAFARALGVSPQEWFGALADNWGDLAANYYPPIGLDEGTAAPIYNAAHRDLTVFTVLHQDQSPAGGLSVQFADGTWQDVEPVPETYVVNVGELLTFLSGGRWRAAPHQVTVSADAASGPMAAPRISVPFFYRPNDARIVRSWVDPAADPVAVGDWVLERKGLAS
jgi:isopenicillin N synthase-like dioxygenase